jgi:glycosyltransferase involved in cell wall biosynthesis
VKANILHIDLNACGGAERLAIATIEALVNMGMEIYLASVAQPDLKRLAYAFGEHAIKQLYKIKTNIVIARSNNGNTYDIVVNTHGDMLPHWRHNSKKVPSIVYCHFPLAKYLLDFADSRYLRIIQAFNETGSNIDAIVEDRISDMQKQYMTSSSSYFKEIYEEMLRNSIVITNSEFSQRAILKCFGIYAAIVAPPVDVETFRNEALNSDKREGADNVLVVSRINPSKKIENAIKLARLLKENNIGQRMTIVGNLCPEFAGYYSHLQHLITSNDLTEYVKLEPNISFGKLLQLMAESKVYFHPLPGEPFGISTAEAMSAGVIPVIPSIGGSTEFVPKEYHFHTFGEAVELISSALDKPQSERNRISRLVHKFSIANYARNIRQVVSSMT